MGRLLMREAPTGNMRVGRCPLRTRRGEGGGLLRRDAPHSDDERRLEGTPKVDLFAFDV